jgi:hypothetical protein
MARLVKNAEKWHRVTIKAKDGAEMILQGRPNRLELGIWCAHTETGRSGFAWFSGQAALRAMAKEILKPKRRRAHNGPAER